MVEPWFHEIARQRHQELLVRAERYRLGRSIREPNAHRRTAPRQLRSRRCVPRGLEEL